MDYTCFDPHTVYMNEGNQTKNITLKIADHCGGTTRITVLNPNGTPVVEKELKSPGEVALSVDPYHEVHVFCNGGNDTQKACNVTVEAG